MITDGVPGFVTVEVAAERLGLKLRQVQALCHSARLDAYRTGTRPKSTLLIPTASLEGEIARRAAEKEALMRYLPGTP